MGERENVPWFQIEITIKLVRLHLKEITPKKKNKKAVYQKQGPIYSNS